MSMQLSLNKKKTKCKITKLIQNNGYEKIINQKKSNLGGILLLILKAESNSKCLCHNLHTFHCEETKGDALVLFFTCLEMAVCVHVLKRWDLPAILNNKMIAVD